MSDRPRILVVDDEMGPRESLRMILKPQYDILTAESGQAALRELPRYNPDMVITDIKMPLMDGIELLRRVKGLDPSIEVVMITAYASLETVKKALTFGAFEYLIKPFSRQDLEDSVRRALARRHTELGARGELTTLVADMRALATKTRELEEEARREQAEQSLRVTQLSILRQLSRGILGELELSHLTNTLSEQLREAMGYDEVRVHFGETLPSGAGGAAGVVCPIRDGDATLGHLLVANQATGRPIDPREAELLEMLSDYLVVAIRNSRRHEEMLETKRSLEQLIQSAADAIISLDPQDTVVGWNPAAERIFGLGAREAVGRRLTDLLPAERYRAAREMLSPDRPVQTFELVTTREIGDRLHLDITLSALVGRQGGLEGVLAIVRDATAQRELEAQMLQSEKLTALGQMAGGIAHDFNNLLQAILGYSQLMRKDPANTEVVRRGLGVIEGAATSGAETVRKIQKFARLRPDEPDVSFDLNQVIQEAVAFTRPRWEERAAKAGIPLQLDLHLGPLPMVTGRPAEFNEVVTNLILNAIDAMPEGGRLELRTEAEGDRVVLTVADTGGGMTDAVRKRIFDPFFTTKGERGTGLGLSVSYSIVKRHGGEMRVESGPGQGAVFTILLPVGASEPSPPAPAPEGAAVSRPAKILLVENDESVLSAMSDILRDAGHHVRPLTSAQDALRALAAEGFDLVMSDIAMSGMNGWEFAERLRSRDRRLPLVFVTGWGLQDEDRERCRGLGVSACLFKPVRPADLLRTVEDSLERQAAGSGPPPAALV